MKPATQIVHWPGKETAACDDHLQKLVGLAAVLGFPLGWTPCEPTICANCETEQRKRDAIDAVRVQHSAGVMGGGRDPEHS